MSGRYEHIFSARPRAAVRLIYPEGGFNKLPNAVRWRGPWTGLEMGEIARLKPEYRLALARDGYVLIEGRALDFSAEVS